MTTDKNSTSEASDKRTTKGSRGTCARCGGHPATGCTSLTVSSVWATSVVWLCDGCLAGMRAVWAQYLSGKTKRP
jgi:hypothetical protein